MPKVRRIPPQQHLVVVDTNILWDKDKKVPVSPEFDNFWKKNSSRIPMTLKVPEVVFGELHFQQTTSALKALTNINENFKELAGITSTKYLHKCNESKIKLQVHEKLQKWLKGHEGILVETPISKIDWVKVVDAAIWRKSPFTFDPKDPKNEKGFRDALILETLIHTCTITSINTTVIFISNDNLLRTAAEEKLKSSEKLLAFESLADFESYIHLTQQKLTNNFVKLIQNHARIKFFTKNDPNCIYIKHNLASKISTDFASEFSFQSPFENKLALLLQGNNQSTVDAKLIRQKNLIRSTQFSNLNGTREFHWISHVDVVCLYSNDVPQGLLSATMPHIRKLKIIGFDVKWKSNVKADGRFHDMSLEQIEKKDSQLIDATEENLAQWRLT